MVPCLYEYLSGATFQVAKSEDSQDGEAVSKMVRTIYIHNELIINSTFYNKKSAMKCEMCECEFNFIYCEKCGFKNDSENEICAKCDANLVSVISKIKSNVAEATSNVIRDTGVQIQVICPVCEVKAIVPPGCEAIGCKSCQSVYAAPSIASATSFHFFRIANTISSSIQSLFNESHESAKLLEIPKGILIKRATAAKEQEIASTDAPMQEELHTQHIKSTNMEQDIPTEFSKNNEKSKNDTCVENEEYSVKKIEGRFVEL